MKTGRKLYLIVQTLLLFLLTVSLADAAVSVFREGMILKAQDPGAMIYTRELAARKLAAAAPLFFLTAGMTIAGLILGISGNEEPAGHIGRREESEKDLPGDLNRAGHAGQRGTGTARALLLALAVCLIAAGVINQSARDVFTKAAKICTECIGLG